jgi:hypothetical protein
MHLIYVFTSIINCLEFPLLYLISLLFLITGINASIILNLETTRCGKNIVSYKHESQILVRFQKSFLFFVIVWATDFFVTILLIYQAVIINKYDNNKESDWEKISHEEKLWGFPYICLFVPIGLVFTSTVFIICVRLIPESIYALHHALHYYTTNNADVEEALIVY